jgi:hypothetical protein
VELDVLEVEKTGAGAARHGDPVPARPLRVGRVQVHAPEAAGGEDRLAGQNRADRAGRPLQQIGADDRGGAVAVGRLGRIVREGQEIDGRRLQEPVDVLFPPETEVTVEKGARVQGGATPIGIIKELS